MAPHLGHCTSLYIHMVVLQNKVTQIWVAIYYQSFKWFPPKKGTSNSETPSDPRSARQARPSSKIQAVSWSEDEGLLWRYTVQTHYLQGLLRVTSGKHKKGRPCPGHAYGDRVQRFLARN